jgi:hypothetical protein
MVAIDDQPLKMGMPSTSVVRSSRGAFDFGRRFWERYGDPATPGTLAFQARAKRWATFHARFPDLAEMRVIDLGGYARSWAVTSVRPRDLTVVNLDGPGMEEDKGGATRTVRADACDLPAELFADRFDLVYSNSVLEHVGGRWRRQAFADAVTRLAPHCWIQTPSPSFPIEPHWLFPGFQFLPTAAQVRVSKHWAFGSEDMTGREDRELVDACLSVELVSPTELRDLFPDAELLRERLFGITKSIIAVR